MATFVMFGKYSLEGVKGISSERTGQANALIEKYGGKLRAMYVLLGPTDLVGVVDFPGTEQAIQASVALSKLIGISITTSPAVTVEAFDRLVAAL